jgi:hypothetical protein
MAKDQKNTITVQGTAIAIVSQHEADYISLTDIARYRDSERTDYIIQNWLRNRNTIEFMGIWESLNNPDFKPIEFDGFRKQSGLNSFILTAKLNYRIHTDAIKDHLIPATLTPEQISFTYANEADVLNVALCGQTARQWREDNPELEGNMRDYAEIEQLLVLANIEGMNAEFIRMGLPQPARLVRLNQIAIRQLHSLTSRDAAKVLDSKPGTEKCATKNL